MLLTLFLLCAIWFAPVQGRPLNQLRGLTQLAKFVASLVVVLGHEGMFYRCGFAPWVVREMNYGQLCVAFFFFMSGYGLQLGAMRKGVDRGWLWKRVPKLVVPALTASALYVATRAALGKDVDWGCYLRWNFLDNANLPYGWFVPVILTLYVVFYVCHRILPQKKAFAAVHLAVAGMMGSMLCLRFPTWYIVGLPCFLMGMWLPRLEESPYRVQAWDGRLWTTLTAVLLLVSIRLNWVQEWIPFLNRWRYMYMSFYVQNVLLVLALAYVLMRLPATKWMEHRGGGTFMKYT